MSMRTRNRIDAAIETPKELPLRAPGVKAHRSYVFYGRSGTGKTTLACTFPDPILLLDINDSGDDSVADLKTVQVMDVKQWGDFELAYWWIVQHKKRFRTLVIDTASQLQQLAMVHIISKKNKNTEDVGAWGAMTKSDWGAIASLMKVWITNLRDLPMDVVFIAQDRVFNLGDEESGESIIDPEVGPAMSPSIAKHLNAAVHVIGNTFLRHRIVEVEKKGKKRKRERIEFCLRVGPNPTYITKIRKPKAIEPPSVIVNPSFRDLVNIITGS